MGYCKGNRTQMVPATRTTTRAADAADAGRTIMFLDEQKRKQQQERKFPETEEDIIQEAEATMARELENISVEDCERTILDFHGIETTSTRIILASPPLLPEKSTEISLRISSSSSSSSSSFDLPPIDAVPDVVVDSDQQDEKMMMLKLDEQLDQELVSMQKKKPDHGSSSSSFSADAYLRAKQYNENYVRTVRLRCLRAERLHVKAAAELLSRHFAIKQELFVGYNNNEEEETILGRDVTLSDLTQEERDILKLGNMQVLPTRDAAGRTILVYRCRNYKNIESLARCHWYFLNRCLRDEETQKKGFVVVFFLLDDYHDDDPQQEQQQHQSPYLVRRMKDYFQAIQRIHRVRTGIPERIVGAHFCYHQRGPSLLLHRSFVAGIQLLLCFLNNSNNNNNNNNNDCKSSSTLRLLRLRTHAFETARDIHFVLQTFGIDTSDLPLGKGTDNDESWNIDGHLEWLQLQHQAEEKSLSRSTPTITTLKGGEQVVVSSSEEEEEEVILVPRRFDVLFGQHKSIRQHTGNLRALHLVEMYWNQYETANKYHKTEVTDRIVQIIYESKGRFLKWEERGGAWVQVVDHDVAREKIAHYFRYMRSKVKGQKENPVEKSTDCSGTAAVKSSKRRTTTHPTQPSTTLAPKRRPY